MVFGVVKYIARSCLHLNRYGKEYREHHAFLQTTVLENSIPSIPSIPRTHRVYSTAQTLRVPHREVCPDPRAKVGNLLTARVPHTSGDRKQPRAAYPNRQAAPQTNACDILLHPGYPFTPFNSVQLRSKGGWSFSRRFRTCLATLSTYTNGKKQNVLGLSRCRVAKQPNTDGPFIF
jgi:hypothetical protein